MGCFQPPGRPGSGKLRSGVGFQGAFSVTRNKQASDYRIPRRGFSRLFAVTMLSAAPAAPCRTTQARSPKSPPYRRAHDEGGRAESRQAAAAAREEAAQLRSQIQAVKTHNAALRAASTPAGKPATQPKRPPKG